MIGFIFKLTMTVEAKTSIAAIKVNSTFYQESNYMIQTISKDAIYVAWF